MHTYACPGKTRYRSASEARRTALHAMRFRSRRIRVYFCRDCRGWHLTKNRAERGPRPRGRPKPDPVVP